MPPKPAATQTKVKDVETNWMNEGMKVWVEQKTTEKPEDICFKQGSIQSISGQDIGIVYDDKKTDTVKAAFVSSVNNYGKLPNGYEDMVEMENLSEAELLYNLEIRLKKDLIFTYVGPTLIVMNPFRAIPTLYLPELLKDFQQSVKDLTFAHDKFPPHGWAISAATIANLARNQRNQAIVISGESGAGKTESAKISMKFLTGMNDAGKPVEEAKSDQPSIEDKILACNPILESFGNAKTVRNDNSSRFGKYVSLMIEQGGGQKITGATITNYLLEKSRIVTQGPNERNYHIFYHLLDGASEEKLKELKFPVKGKAMMEKLEYLNKSGCYEVINAEGKKGIDDVELFEEVSTSFKTMKFSTEETEIVWTLVSCSLHLGNLKFDDAQNKNDESKPCEYKDEGPLRNTSALLQVDHEELSKALRFKFRVIQGKVIESAQNMQGCITARDSLAKELFNRLFNWLVKRLNYTVMPPQFLVDGADIPELMESYYHIGLLDIFGFEIFKKNSIEQFCINYTNEKLQQLYISYVFKGEEKVFVNEGLKDFLGELEFKDNQPVIDLLDLHPMGIFQLVDSACQTKPNDENLCGTILKQHAKNPKIGAPRMAKMDFIVYHTASPVTYCTDGFCFKNLDELGEFIEKALFNSKLRMVPRVYKCLCGNEEAPVEDGTKKKSKDDKYLGAKFRKQIKELMTELNSCECHFVRCIKPNSLKVKHNVMQFMTLQQIQCMGILDTLKIRKESYPVRRPYNQFFEQFGELSSKHSSKTYVQHCKDGADFRAMTTDLMKEAVPNMGTNLVLFGTTKIFLRVQADVELKQMYAEKMKAKVAAATRLQKVWRKYAWMKKLSIVKAKVKGSLRGIRTVQRLFRVGKEYKHFQRIRRSTRKIQRSIRRKLARRKMIKLKTMVFKLQAWWKKVFLQRRFRRQKSAAMFINRVWRGGIARGIQRRVKYIQTIMLDLLNLGTNLIYVRTEERAAVQIQRIWRGHRVRVEHADKVEQAKAARENFVVNKNAAIIQRTMKGVLVRMVINRLHRAAFYIQGYFRKYWLSNTFQALRKSTRMIQRAFRKRVTYDNIVQERLEQYLMEDHVAFEGNRMSEHNTLFGAIGSENGIRSDPYSHQLHSVGQFNKIKEVTPYTTRKITFIVKIIDLDILTDVSDIYDPLWSIQALKLQNEVVQAPEVDIQLLEVGESHTVAVSNLPKVYSWGWNDTFQLGRSKSHRQTIYHCQPLSFPDSNFRPKQLAAGDEHSVLLDTENNLYNWGSNSKGQLGLGHTKDVSRINMLEFTNNDPIVHIKAKGHNTLAITESGAAYYWPVEKSAGEIITRPLQLHIPSKVQIKQGSCGHNFTILLSKSGLVYSFGKDNSAGQLGFGDTYSRQTPTLINSIKNDGEKITQAFCGFKHVVCKTSLGKIYVWGWGSQGQLGLGDFRDQYVPCQVNLASMGGYQKSKVLQVQAGFRNSIVLLDNKKIYWAGTSGSSKERPFFEEVQLQDRIPGYTKTIDLTPIKVQSTWSKTMSVTYVTISDTRTLTDVTVQVKNKTLSTLIQKIEDGGSCCDMDPPYVESISKYFSPKLMKIPFSQRTPSGKLEQEKKKKGVRPKSSAKPLRQKSIDLNKTGFTRHSGLDSTHDHDGRSSIGVLSTKKSDFNRIPGGVAGQVITPGELLSAKSSQYFTNGNGLNLSDNASQRPLKDLNWSEKIMELRKKLDEILAIPRERWSDKDREFMQLATEPKMLNLLHGIK